MSQKVGRRYTKSNKDNRPIVTSSGGDFTSVVDGITFGVVNGQWFHSGNRAWKPKNNCPHCKLIRSCDEARKHPSVTSLEALGHQIFLAKQYTHVERMCDEHQNPQKRRDIALIVEHWYDLLWFRLEQKQRIAA